MLAKIEWFRSQLQMLYVVEESNIFLGRPHEDTHCVTRAINDA